MFKLWKSASILVVLALVLSLGLVMAPLAGTAGAATLRVPQDYNTIQDAINDARAGDLILVGPGEYPENLRIWSGEYDRTGLTIRSTGGAQNTIIIGTGPRAPGVAVPSGGPVVDIYDVNGITFQGFTVVAGTSFSPYGIPLPGCGILMFNASNCLITDNNVTENEAGILVLGGTISPMMPLAGGEGVGADGGIELVSDGNTIRDNEVYYNGGVDGVGGVGADGMMGTGLGIVLINCNETTVEGNEVYNNQFGGVLVMGGNIWMGDGDTMGGGTVGQLPPTFMGVARDNRIIDNKIYYEERPRGVMQPMFPPPGVMLWNTLRTTVSGNEISDHFFGVSILGMTGEVPWGMYEGEAKGNVVSDNEIYDNYLGVGIFGPEGGPFLGDLFGEAVGNGIPIYASDNDVTGNTIKENGEGVDVLGANNTRILGNDILNNTGGDTGIHIEYDPYGTTEVHFNNIVGNSVISPKAEGVSSFARSYGVYNHPQNPVLDATFNWWGEDDESGPYDPESISRPPLGETEVCPCTNDPRNEKNTDGKGDAVSSNVDYCPWLLERFCPATSASSTTGEGEVGFNTSDWDSAIIQKLADKDPSEICPPKPEMFFPYGVFSFTVLLKNIGGTVTVTLTLPEDMPQGTKYWKCQNGEWVDVTSLLGDDDGDNILTLTLTDGGLGDADGVANGRIDDPGGPSIPIPLSTLTGEGKKAVETAGFTSSYLRITPPEASPNQAVEVAVNVANTGEERGSRAVALYINDKAEQSQTVTLAPGSSQNVIFTVTKATPGTYKVLVEGQRGQFVVRSTSIFGGGGLGTGGIIAIVIVLIALIIGLILVMRGVPGKA